MWILPSLLLELYILLYRINAADCSMSHLQNIRCFLSCLMAKCLPDVPLALHHTPSLKKFNSRWRKRDLRFAMKMAFRKSNKNSPVYKRCWKCCLPGRMHSVQLQKTLFTLWSSLEIVKISRRMFLSSSRMYSCSRITFLQSRNYRFLLRSQL